MDKPFKTIKEQIEILKNRGLIIPNEERAATILLFNNYYNLINQFCPAFKVPGTDTFLENASFKEILGVYYFDSEIKTTLYKLLSEVEKNFKAVLVYYFSLFHRDNYPYFLVENFNLKKPKELMKITGKISQKIQYALNSSTENSIQHYQSKHGNIPFWVLANELSFNDLIKFYDVMKIQEQNAIAKEFSKTLANNLNIESCKISPQDLSVMLNNICQIRNIVAHSNKLLGYNCPKNMPFIKDLHDYFGVSANESKQDIYNVYLMTCVFVSGKVFDTATKTLRKRINKLKKDLKSISIDEITKQLGFPSHWEDYPKLLFPNS